MDRPHQSRLRDKERRGRSYRSVPFCFLIQTIMAGLLASGCQRHQGGSGQEGGLSEPTKAAPIVKNDVVKPLAEFNQGAALLEQYQYARAAEKFESVLAAFPAWTAARFNLGLALLNLPDAPDALDRAEAEFKRVVAVEPEHRWAHFCLGVLYQHRGEFDKALDHFGKVLGSDPDDPFAGFEYAETLRKLDRNPEALQVLEKVVERDPGFVSAFYSLGMLYNRMHQRDKDVQTLKRFGELKPQELAVGSYGVVAPYAGRGKYFTALAADGLPVPASAMSPAPRVLFSPDVKKIDAPLESWTSAVGKVNVSGVAVGDVDADGDQDVVLAGVGVDGGTVVLFNDGKGNFTSGPRLADKGLVPCLGDIDNDGDLDLWLGRAGQDLLLLGDGKGKFTRAPAQPEPGGEHLTTCARLVDLDSDGDLDLLAMRIKVGSVPPDETQAATASRVFNNNLDGTFADLAPAHGLALADLPVSAVVLDDFDNDRDIDMVVLSQSSQPLCWENFRVGRYRMLDAKATKLDVTGAISATTGNPFKTGNRDLLVFTGKELVLYHNRGRWEFQRDIEFSTQHGSLGGTGGQFVDIDNDGDLDIVIADAHRRDGSRGPALLLNDWPNTRFVDAAAVDPGNILGRWNCDGDAVCVAADFNGDGKPDLLHAAMGRSPVLFVNATQGGNWLALDLLGQRGQDQTSRSSSSAIGARVEFRSGNVTQQYVVGTPAGATAMPALRVQAGIGHHRTVDWLRIQWPDSLLQAELEMVGNQVVTLPETCRRTSSCPHLFAWNGQNFAFVSDFGGVGGLGYRTGPSTFARPDPTEYVLLPELAPRDGDFILQVVEPLEEVVYFDEAKLIAVDHPAGTSVHPHEMAAVAADPPPFEIFCYSQVVKPARAVNDRGEDVTLALEKSDRIYVSPSQRDGRFAGFARDHFVELDFADRLGSLPAGSRWVLLLDGWVEYSTSTSNFAASQAGLRLKAPSLAALRDGYWVELLHEGDVTELVQSGDDRFAILAAGDEITLRFPVSAFGPVPPGCVRTFLLKSDSFCKDMDLYTGGSTSVEPLPFHAMKSYPYGPDEHYPDTNTTRRYRQQSNTRIIAGPGADAVSPSRNKRTKNNAKPGDDPVGAVEAWPRGGPR